MEQFEHGKLQYAVQHSYDLGDDAWCVELSEALRAPQAWAEIPGAVSHVPGSAFVIAVVPDEDPRREPTIHFCGGAERDIPYQVMRWFMEKVTEEVERCHLALIASAEGDVAPPETRKVGGSTPPLAT
jgi:hypothetical protein